MSAPPEMPPVGPARVSLVTIVAAEELLEGLEECLNAIDVSGYTICRAEGRGAHGVRKTGFLSIGNVRIETLVRPAAAHKLLEYLERAYAGRALLAYSHEVDAIPRSHFV